MTTTPNPTAESVIADAITAYWADEERSGPNRGPLAHDFACGEAAAAALRAHGLLSEGAPSEEQIERAAKEFERAWDESIDSFDPEQHDAMSYIKTAMRAALVAAGVAPQGSDKDLSTSPEHVKNEGDSLQVVPPTDREKLITEDLGYICSHEVECGDTCPSPVPRESIEGLDPEKVAEVLIRDECFTRDPELSGWTLSPMLAARALCEAYTEGKLT